MPFRIFICMLVLLSGAACKPQERENHITQHEDVPKQNTVIDTSVLLPALHAINSIAAVKTATRGYWLTASKERGLTIYNTEGELVNNTAGRYEFISARALHNEVVIASVDAGSGDVVLFSFNEQQATLEVKRRLQPLSFQADALCLFKDLNNNLFLFLVDGYGGGEQRWIYDGKHATEIDLHVKGLHLPPDVSSCVAQDDNAVVFYAEENLGLWIYPAQAESEPGRTLLTQPGHTIKALAQADGRLFASQSDSGTIAVYSADKETWILQNTLRFAQPYASESIAVLDDAENLLVAFVNDESTEVLQFKIPKTDAANKHTESSETYAEVYARAETEAVSRRGDAADDPAIWHNPQDVLASRILGTNKKLGLLVYNLQGKLLQTLPVGHVNNVDLRQNVSMSNTSLDIAVASNRSDNSIDLFTITPTGEVEFTEKFATGLREVYGICLYQPEKDKLFILINDKDGRYQQYQLLNDNNALLVKLITEFKVQGQPEACVADDKYHLIYIGEEDKGVWRYAFDETSGKVLPQSAQLIAKAGAELQADIEGLGLYHDENKRYLVVSSQGDNSYAMYDVSIRDLTQNPTYLGSFRVGLNSTKSVDGTTETDGLEVSSFGFGEHYPEGLVVIQDGYNLMPEEPQNFKLVSWREIKNLLLRE